MKTTKFFLAALMCFMVSTACLAGDRIISPDKLPQAAKLYIQNHYKGQKIAYAKIDYDFARKKYEVRLMNGVELKFDTRGNLWDIDIDDDYYRANVQYIQGQAPARVYYDDDDDFYDD